MEEINLKDIINSQELFCEDLEPLKDFSILWSIFEFKLCDTRYSKVKIGKKLREMNLSKSTFKFFYDYLKERYSGNGFDLFEGLKFENPKDKSSVKDIIIDKTFDSESDYNIIFALMLVVYRFRNNFFHWSKAQDNFRDQINNFKHANSFLLILIESIQ